MARPGRTITHDDLIAIGSSDDIETASWRLHHPPKPRWRRNATLALVVLGHVALAGSVLVYSLAHHHSHGVCARRVRR